MRQTIFVILLLVYSCNLMAHSTTNGHIHGFSFYEMFVALGLVIIFFMLIRGKNNETT